MTICEKLLELQGASVLRRCTAASLCGLNKQEQAGWPWERALYMLPAPSEFPFNHTGLCWTTTFPGLSVAEVGGKIPYSCAGRNDTMELESEALPCPDGVTISLFHKVGVGIK